MLVALAGGREAAMARMAAAGWSRADVGVNGAAIPAMAKGGALVAFDPTDPDSSSLPMAAGGWGAFAPLGRGDPLYEEAMDLLCGTDPHANRRE